MQNTGLTNFQAARLIVSKKAPYLSMGLWSLIPVQLKEPLKDNNIIMADKYWRIYYCEKQLEEVDIVVISSCIVQILWHLLNRHAKRRNDRIIEKWNLSTKLAIYPCIKETGLPISEKMSPAEYNLYSNCAAEEYYEDLPDNAGIAQSYYGSCQDGVPQEHELPLKPADNKELSGIDVDRKFDENIIKQVGEDVKKSIGNQNGMMLRFLKICEESNKVPWQKKLANGLYGTIACGMVDYSYKRPNKKQVCMCPGLILPGFVKYDPEVAIVLDVSGSMYDAVKEALKEVRTIVRSVGGSSIRVLPCDVDVQDVIKVSGSTTDFNFNNDGGTDMRVGIGKADKLIPHPDVIITITDGYTPWPIQKPKARHISVIVERTGSRPSFGEVIYID